VSLKLLTHQSMPISSPALPSVASTLFTTPEGWVEFREVPLREPGEHAVRIRTQWSYISAGTEMNAVLGCRNRVAAFSQPRRLGYSLTGMVEAVGAKVEHVKPGDRVAAIGDGAFHATHVTVGRNLVVPLPEGVSAREASCMAMFCFSLEAIRKAALQFGEKALVLGGGMMGQIVSRLAAISGAETILMEGNAFRRSLTDPRVAAVEPDEAGWESVRARLGATGLEVGFVCFGGDATEPVRKMIGLMARGPDQVAHGRIVFSGGASVHLQMASPSGNVRFLSSAKAGPGYRDAAFEQGADYTGGYVPWTVKRNMEVLLHGLKHGLLETASLVTHEFAFHQAAEAYALLGSGDAPVMAAVLNYDERKLSFLPVK